MTLIKRTCLLFILLVLSIAGYSGDSLQVNSFNSIKFIALENNWLNTGNSSGLYFNGKKKMTTFDAGTTIKYGDFHRICEGGDINQYSFSTKSSLPLGNKLNVAGGFSYNNLEETGARWSGVYDPYRGNPYILADSVSDAKWHKENYSLSGQMSYNFSSTLIFGCGLDYYVSVAAKQRDPRPENIVTRIEFHPSLILRKRNYNLGLDLGYRNRKEQISYNTYRSNFTPIYFVFKGFGVYSTEIEDGYTRFQSVKEVFGGIQFEKELKGLQNLSELRVIYSFEGIEDGSSTIIKENGGDWQTIEARLNEQLKKSDGKNRHIVGGNFSFFKGDGTEYTQTKVKDGDNYRYITIAKNLKFTRQTLSADISYNYLKMLNKTDVDWDISTSVSAINNSEKYYYIPEVFTSSYFNISANAEVQKNFYLGKVHIAPTINTAYISNISNDLLLSNLQEITNTQRQDVYLQEFGCYTADVLKLGGRLQLGYSPSQLKGIDQINLNLEFDYWKPMELETTSTLISAKVGFVF
jgi:hypothetical protein